MKSILFSISLLIGLYCDSYCQSSNLRFNSLHLHPFGKIDDTSKIPNYDLLIKTFNSLTTNSNNQVTDDEKAIIEEISNGDIDTDYEKLVSDYNFTSSKGTKDINRFLPIKVLAEQIDYYNHTKNNYVWFPVHNDIQAELFYNEEYTGKSQILKNTNFVMNPNNGKLSVSNEVYADYFGIVRLGIGVLVSNKDNKSTIDSATHKEIIDTSSAKNDAFQRLLGGGGNISLGASVPCFIAPNFLDLKIEFAPKISLDVPNLGTETNKFSTNCDIGITTTAVATGMLGVIGVYSIVRIGAVDGNGLFHVNLGQNFNGWFWFHSATIGIAINSTFRIAWTTYLGDPFVTHDFPSVVSFSIIPN
jgi:hypothetical protein